MIYRLILYILAICAKVLICFFALLDVNSGRIETLHHSAAQRIIGIQTDSLSDALLSFLVIK
jgi:hypothetical protein